MKGCGLVLKPGLPWLMLGVALLLASAVCAQPQCAGCTAAVCDECPAFTPDLNFMSCAGYMRLKVYRETGEWIAMCRARALAMEECDVCGAAFASSLPQTDESPVRATCEGKPFSPPVNYMSLRGYTRYQIYLETGEWVPWADVDVALAASAE